MSRAQVRTGYRFQFFNALERLRLLPRRRVRHPGAVDKKWIIFPYGFCFFNFCKGFVNRPAANEKAYLPGGAKGRAEFVSLTQELEGSLVISLEVVRNCHGSRDD